MLRPRRRDKHAGAVLAGEASAAAADVEVAPAPPAADPRAAAFFDIDNTIMVGASIYHLARGSPRASSSPAGTCSRFGWQQVAFRVGGAERAQGLATARESALLFVAGREVDEINRLGGEILRRNHVRAHLRRELWRSRSSILPRGEGYGW